MESLDKRSTGVVASAESSGDEPGRTGKRVAPRRFSAGKQLLFSVIIIVGLLLVAEAVVRIWALYFRTSYERYNAQTGRLELRPNVRYTNARGQEFRINSKGFVGPEFDEQPAAETYRIMAVGDSCTFGTGFWEIAYPAVLQRLLNGGGSPGRYEVINAGIEGFNSTFARARIHDELLRYRPRLMIVYLGWNDLMKTDPAGEASVDEHRRLATLLDSSYLIKAYKKLLFVYLRPLALRPTTAERPEDATAFDDFEPTRYRSNLDHIIRELQKNGMKVVLVTLPTVVRPGMTEDELRRANVFFPYFAGAYGVSRLLSLHRAYNRTIVDAGRRHHVEVVDLAGVFQALPDRRPYFWDTMHASDRGHVLIAETLSSRIRQLEAEGRL